MKIIDRHRDWLIPYLVILILIYYYYQNYGYLNFDRDNKINYEYNGFIPKNNRKVIVYSCLIGDNDNIISFNIKTILSIFIFQFLWIKANILNDQEENLNLLLSLLKKLNNYEQNSLSLYKELGIVYSNERVF